MGPSLLESLPASVLQLPVAWTLAFAAVPVSAETLRVGTVGELHAAFEAASPGTRIELAAAEFRLDRPLVVPDGVTLSGGGRMTVDAAGRAAGLADGTAATLALRGDWRGNGLSLGDGAELRGLRVVDFDAGATPPDGRKRNVVAVVSRRAGDRVVATLRDCEIETSQPFGVGGDGPLGRAIVVMTLNAGDAGGPHSGAHAGLRLERSVVRAPESNAVFAINFASRGRVDLRIDDSVLAGVLSATGGTARQDVVDGASTTLRSRNSRYLRTGRYDRFGWQLLGGSGVPHPGVGSAAGSERNELDVDSRGDAIEGFRTGVYAAGGRRVGGLSGPSIGNVARLRLRDLAIEGAGEAPVDFELSGALAEPAPGGAAALPPGDSNLLHVDLRGFRRGAGSSRYEAVRGPGGRDDNRLEFAGDPGGFARSNPAFRPVPGEEFFSR